MSTTHEAPAPAGGGDATLTIGAVCEALREDFPSISISKIRYLEDQKLITPRRTPGGYRMFTPMDVERLRTILRLQRDEFMPLRVIRQELESSAGGTFSAAGAAKQLKRAALTGPAPARRHSLEELAERTGAPPALIRELEEYGLLDGRDGFDEIEREVVQAAVELGAYGVQARHLRLFRTAAEREAGLLEQLLTTGLRSRNPERRREALEALEDLAALVSHMRHLMLVSELRGVVQAS
jgi:DNA-binding transcriptional MerR regulator